MSIKKNTSTVVVPPSRPLKLEKTLSKQEVIKKMYIVYVCFKEDENICLDNQNKEIYGVFGPFTRIEAVEFVSYSASSMLNVRGAFIDKWI